MPVKAPFGQFFCNWRYINHHLFAYLFTLANVATSRLSVPNSAGKLFHVTGPATATKLGQVWRRQAIQTIVDQHYGLKVLADLKPIQITQYRCDVVLAGKLTCFCLSAATDAEQSIGVARRRHDKRPSVTSVCTAGYNVILLINNLFLDSMWLRRFVYNALLTICLHSDWSCWVCVRLPNTILWYRPSTSSLLGHPLLFCRSTILNTTFFTNRLSSFLLMRQNNFNFLSIIICTTFYLMSSLCLVSKFVRSIF